MGSATGKANRKVGYDEAVAELAALKPRLEEAAATLSARSAELLAPYELAKKRAMEAAKAADELLKQVNAGVDGITGEVKRMRRRLEQLKRVVDRGPGREATVRGKVENPKRADELVAQQLENGSAGELIEQGRFAGLVDVDIRLSTRIGGLSRIKERDEWQTLAAARFRSLWDQAQIGGAKAIDYEQVRVDTSRSSVDAVSSIGEDARREYAMAVQQLGMVKSNLVQRVVCDDMSLRALARKLGRPDGFRAREALKSEVLDSVDVLVRVFKMGPAQSRVGIRAEAERPTDWGGANSGGEEHDVGA